MEIFNGRRSRLLLARQIRKFGDENVISSEINFAYGIQVSISGEYLISYNLSLKGEMKFRDPQLSVRNTYTKKNVQYNGSLVTVPVDSFDLKINVDGVTFVFGIAYSF